MIASAAGWGAWSARSLRSGPGWTATQEFSLSVAVGLGILGRRDAWTRRSRLAEFPDVAGPSRGRARWLEIWSGSGDSREAGCHADTDGRLANPDHPIAPSRRPGRHVPILRLHRRQTTSPPRDARPPAPLRPALRHGVRRPPAARRALAGRGQWLRRARISLARPCASGSSAAESEFLPHNVYTSFPQQTEILYLLLMHLHRRRARRRDPLAIAARFDGRSCRLRYRGLAAGGLAANRRRRSGRHDAVDRVLGLPGVCRKYAAVFSRRWRRESC